jgi:hypothetical protein
MRPARRLRTGTGDGDPASVVVQAAAAAVTAMTRMKRLLRGVGRLVGSVTVR